MTVNPLVFSTPKFRVLSADVECHAGSDCRPVLFVVTAQLQAVEPFSVCNLVAPAPFARVESVYGCVAGLRVDEHHDLLLDRPPHKGEQRHIKYAVHLPPYRLPWQVSVAGDAEARTDVRISTCFAGDATPKDPFWAVLQGEQELGRGDLRAELISLQDPARGVAMSHTTLLEPGHTLQVAWDAWEWEQSAA